MKAHVPSDVHVYMHDGVHQNSSVRGVWLWTAVHTHTHTRCTHSPIITALPLGSTARYCPGTMRRHPLLPNVSWCTCNQNRHKHKHTTEQSGTQHKLVQESRSQRLLAMLGTITWVPDQTGSCSALASPSRTHSSQGCTPGC